MSWTVIVIPAAGRGRTRKMLDEITRAAKTAGAEVEVSPEPGAPERLAKEAADSGHDLVACGGDGVVTEVAGVAADTGRRLAIVPTGAGNDFARMPRSKWACAAALHEVWKCASPRCCPL